jgi:hypothetical protein
MKPTTATALLYFAAFTLAAITAHAAATPRFEFAKDVISSIGAYTSAVNQYTRDVQNPTSAEQVMTDTMMLNRNIAYSRSFLDKYESSHIWSISEGALRLRKNYSAIIDYNKRYLELLEQTMNGAPNRGTQVRQRAEIASAVTATQEEMVKSLVFALSAIYDPSKSTATHREYIINRAELLALRRHFDKTFGANAPKRYVRGMSVPQSMIVAIWLFISHD